jgi:hypothetical protein
VMITADNLAIGMNFVLKVGYHFGHL